MKPLHFLPEPTPFIQELRERIDAYFAEHKLSKYANRSMKSKIALFIGVYILSYTLLYTVNSSLYLYVVYAFMGAWSVLMGLNIGHDAAHKTIFRRPKSNRRFLLVFEFLGTNSYNWVNRHLGAHHLFPNVMDYDSDIQQTKVVKIFPKDEHRTYHALQFIYMPIVYMVYIFRWIVYRDFKDVFSKKIGAFNNTQYPWTEVLKMIIFKSFYLFQMIVLPSYLLNVSIWTTLTGFIILTIVGSLTITLVLLSTHVGEDANFPEPDSNNCLPHSWSYHQIITAADFSTQNRFINYFFGGFNHHVMHHLFPNICHIHYPQLTPILKELAEKYDLPYRHQKYLFAAVLSHFKLLRANSKSSLRMLEENA